MFSNVQSVTAVIKKECIFQFFITVIPFLSSLTLSVAVPWCWINLYRSVKSHPENEGHEIKRKKPAFGWDENRFEGERDSGREVVRADSGCPGGRTAGSSGWGGGQEREGGGETLLFIVLLLLYCHHLRCHRREEWRREGRRRGGADIIHLLEGCEGVLPHSPY